MYRSNRSFFTKVFLGIVLAVACAPQEPEVAEGDDDEDDDRGGTGTGLTPGNGGSIAGTYPTNGGTVGVGGTPPVTGGGTVGTGGFAGVVATGGIAGVQAQGGAFPMGGSTAGGAFPMGGVSGAAVGGAAAGTPAAGAGGGGMVACGAAFEAGADGFVRAPGTTGCWHGYASAGGDVGTMVMPTSFAMCGMGCMLHVTGTLGPANAANSYAGFAFLGFNTNQAAGASTFTTIAPTGSSLVIAYTKTAGPAMIRVQLQAGATRWCANLTASPATIPYTMFNTACWDNTGTAYAKQPIDAVQLVAPGGEAAQPVDMTLISVKDT